MVSRSSRLLTSLVLWICVVPRSAHPLAAGPFTSPTPPAIPQVRASMTLPQTAPSTDWPDRHQDLRLPSGTHDVDYGLLPPQTILGETTRFPSRVDLSRYAPPVGDQGWVSDCVAWATIYTLAGWYINEQHATVGYLAPLFTYSQINGHQDEGTWESPVLAAVQHGMLPLADYPQGNYAWRSQPTARQRALARHVTLTGITYYPGQAPQIGDPHEWDTNQHRVRSTIETVLAAGHPALIGLAVYPNLYNATATTAWIAPVAADAAGSFGGHELVVMGYDNAGAWVENSWGTSWGLHGYAEISWPYLEAAVSSIISVAALLVTAAPPTIRRPDTPTITATVLRDGAPQPRTASLVGGEEVVWAGAGFRPNEAVSLHWDGTDHGYVTALPDGTWSLEWYDHQQRAVSAHNIRPAPGTYVLRACDARGPCASVALSAA